MIEKPELKITELRTGLFLINDSDMSNAYLLVGEEKACLIDTGNGFCDIGKAVRELTDKSIVVINTHGHPDHVYGNDCFDHVYLNSEDWALADSFIKVQDVLAESEAKGHQFPDYTDIKQGDIFDLGGRTLMVYNLPGHTKGSIVLLCPEERILFTGDAINHHLWMQLDCSLPMEVAAAELENKLFLMEEADVILHGHAKGFDDSSLMQYVLDGMKEIIAGKNEDDMPYSYFEEFHAMFHPFTVDSSKQFENYENGIAYQINNIKNR